MTNVMIYSSRSCSWCRRSVPQIFIGGSWIGGYDDLVRLDDSGRLEPLLADPAS